jgi:hypothetical protein
VANRAEFSSSITADGLLAACGVVLEIGVGGHARFSLIQIGVAPPVIRFRHGLVKNPRGGLTPIFLAVQIFKNYLARAVEMRAAYIALAHFY